ncbi:MAG: hypothetical protein OXI17_00015 [Gammaproteobacteria bacterium]|nr:hypothetical protein [Gammaproteobacteria bacterium]
MRIDEPWERQLFDGFLEALRELPDVRVKLGGTPQAGKSAQVYDAQVNLNLGQEAVTLLVEAKKALFPRDVRQLLWKVREVPPDWPLSSERRQTVSCLIAETISPGAKDLLRDEGVGYYDSGGSLFLPAGRIYVYVDKPPPKSESKSMRSLFSGRSAQVLHTVLMRHGGWLGVNEVAEVAQVSPATASQVLKELEKFDWAESRGQGPGKKRQLREPGALLDAWTQQLAVMQPPIPRRYFVPSVRTGELTEALAEACAANNAEYAVTHEAAGQRYAPFLSTVPSVQCLLLANSAAYKVLDSLEAHPVNQGANLMVFEVKTVGEMLFRELLAGIWLASPVQVYLDLMRGEGRGKDLAQHLRRQRIGY